MIVQVMGGPEDGMLSMVDDKAVTVTVDWFDAKGGAPIPMATTLGIHNPGPDARAFWPGYRFP